MEETERPKRILYLITKSNFGGAQRYVYDLSRRLHERGHSVSVGFGGDGTLARKLSDIGVRTHTLEGLGRDVDALGDLRTLFRVLRLIRNERPDVVHLNSSKIGGIGALAARMINAERRLSRIWDKESRPMRIVFTGHGWALNEERPDWERFLIGAAHWATIMLAHRTVAVSERTKREVSILPFSKGRLDVVHNGTGELTLVQKTHARKTLLADEHDAVMSRRPIVIGTIAELHRNKGLSYALEGIAQLKKQTSEPFVFVVIGEGEERERLTAQRAALGLDETVRFVGFREDASALLSAFDIFLFASTKEGFPYAILEAGNAGLPVIATSVGGIPEVIDDMKSGILIQSKNPGEIARALSYLIEHKDRRTEFGKAIKERIEGRFNIDHMVDETLRIYGD